MNNIIDDNILEKLSAFDTATVFNAIVSIRGLPNFDYMDNSIKCLLPNLGVAIGYAVTVEVTTNDQDSPQVPFSDYYDVLNETKGPIFALLKDVDSLPGRGAAFGDNMAALHKRFGVTGAVIDGSIRDLSGINEVGLPVWSSGLVPGHGRFVPTRVNTAITIAGLRVKPRELIMADENGVLRIPVDDINLVLEETLRVSKKERQMREQFSDKEIPYEKLRHGYGWTKNQ